MENVRPIPLRRYARSAGSPFDRPSVYLSFHPADEDKLRDFANALFYYFDCAIYVRRYRSLAETIEDLSPLTKMAVCLFYISPHSLASGEEMQKEVRFVRENNIKCLFVITNNTLIREASEVYGEHLYLCADLDVTTKELSDFPRRLALALYPYLSGVSAKEFLQITRGSAFFLAGMLDATATISSLMRRLREVPEFHSTPLLWIPSFRSYSANPQELELAVNQCTAVIVVFSDWAFGANRFLLDTLLPLAHRVSTDIIPFVENKELRQKALECCPELTPGQFCVGFDALAERLHLCSLGCPQHYMFPAEKAILGAAYALGCPFDANPHLAETLLKQAAAENVEARRFLPRARFEGRCVEEDLGEALRYQRDLLDYWTRCPPATVERCIGVMEDFAFHARVQRTLGNTQASASTALEALNWAERNQPSLVGLARLLHAEALLAGNAFRQVIDYLREHCSDIAALEEADMELHQQAEIRHASILGQAYDGLHKTQVAIRYHLDALAMLQDGPLYLSPESMEPYVEAGRCFAKIPYEMAPKEVREAVDAFGAHGSIGHAVRDAFLSYGYSELGPTCALLDYAVYCFKRGHGSIATFRDEYEHGFEEAMIISPQRFEPVSLFLDGLYYSLPLSDLPEEPTRSSYAEPFAEYFAKVERRFRHDEGAASLSYATALLQKAAVDRMLRRPDASSMADALCSVEVLLETIDIHNDYALLRAHLAEAAYYCLLAKNHDKCASLALRALDLPRHDEEEPSWNKTHRRCYEILAKSCEETGDVDGQRKYARLAEQIGQVD